MNGREGEKGKEEKGREREERRRKGEERGGHGRTWVERRGEERRKTGIQTNIHSDIPCILNISCHVVILSILSCRYPC